MMLHGHVEIQNFSSSVKNYFTGESRKWVKYFLIQEEKFCISKLSCNVLLTIQTPMKYQTISLSYTFSCCARCNLLCSHSNSDLFIEKITCYFDVWRYHVLMRKLTWYFIGIYIMKWIISAACTEPHWTCTV